MKTTMAHSAKYLTPDERKEKLGKIGEDIVAHVLSKIHNVIMSTNKYDNVKDMMVDNLTTEIKTLMYNFATKGIWLNENQWLKCDTVKRLFFVKIPLKGSPLIEIYESINRNKHSIVHEGRCRLYKLTDLQLYDTINCQELAKYMYDLSLSKYK